MSDRKILFIVEGEVDEPKFIKKIFDICASRQVYEFYVYKTNLHTFARRLEEEYPDFDKTEIDIQRVLYSYERSCEAKKVLSQRYTDVFLVFDFEPQHDCLCYDIIRKMMKAFNDSTSSGKLFVNYPMMQSYKHFEYLPDDEFKNLKVTIQECKKYKELIDSLSHYGDVSQYTYEVLISLAVHHLKKANYIISGAYDIPDQAEYSQWELVDVYDQQILHKEKDDWVYVLNTCIFILIDYNPTAFFHSIRSHKCKFWV